MKRLFAFFLFLPVLSPAFAQTMCEDTVVLIRPHMEDTLMLVKIVRYSLNKINYIDCEGGHHSSSMKEIRGFALRIVSSEPAEIRAPLSSSLEVTGAVGANSLHFVGGLGLSHQFIFWGSGRLNILGTWRNRESREDSVAYSLKDIARIPPKNIPFPRENDFSFGIEFEQSVFGSRPFVTITPTFVYDATHNLTAGSAKIGLGYQLQEVAICGSFEYFQTLTIHRSYELEIRIPVF